MNEQIQRVWKKTPGAGLILGTILLVIVLLWGPLTGVQGADQEELLFTVLHTNDEHSAFVPYLSVDNPDRQIGGLSRLATAIESVRRPKDDAGEPVLLLSAGDFLGETAYGWLSTQGFAPEMEWLHLMGYDAVTIGNHEYDFGPDVLAQYLRTAGYPQAHEHTLVLAANTVPPDTHPLTTEELFRPSGVISLDNGLRVGLFGLIGKDAISVTADPGDVTFSDQHETAERQVADLRRQGVDVIIALTHSGVVEDVALAREVEGIDLIVGGHSHTLLVEPVVEGQTLIVQAGAQTSHLGMLELGYSRQTGQLRIRNTDTGRPFVISIGEQYAPHPAVEDQVDVYTRTLNNFVSSMTGGRFTDILGPIARSPYVLTNRPPLQESQVGNFITDGMRMVTAELTGRPVDVAVQANGSIRGSMVPRMGPDGLGDLSFYDITNTIGLGYGADNYPGYSVVSVYLTGEELRRMLEIATLLQELMGDNYFLQFSGLQYRYNPQNTILLTVPLIDQPVPSTRAVLDAHLYQGTGIQPEGGEGFVPLKRGDDTLYHLVTDTYILSFLPMAGELLPQLEVIPKNQWGEPLAPEQFHELTVPHEGRELKVWETVAMYAATFPPGEDGVPVLPQDYRALSARIVAVDGFPLIGWILLGLTVALAGLMLVIRLLILRRRKKRNTPQVQA